MAGYNQTFKDKIAFIKSHYDCISYASRVLGWPIHNDGDRYLSLAPGSTNTTALILHYDTWHDFKTGWGGDVIDLCAFARHYGDKGAAIKELGADFKGEWDESDWKAKTQDLCNKIEYWHTQLRPEDIDYLHGRKINDETIERLKIGFDAKTCRLIVPYFKNGYVAYYAGRDRYVAPMHFIDGPGFGDYPTINQYDVDEHGAVPYHLNPEFVKWEEESKKRSKYQKAALDGYNENIPWGLHTLAPDFRNSKLAELVKEYSPAEDLLCILEGMFDVLSFEQRGFMCLSPIGGYFNKKVNQFVIDTAKQFKKVFVCFDSDAPGQSFNMSMAQLLFANRINFCVGRLPKEINNHPIKDVSDYYTLGGDLIKLVDNAQDGITALASTITLKSEFKRFIYDCARFADKPDLMQLFEYTEESKHFDSVWLDAVKRECLKAPSEKVIVDELLAKYQIKYVEADRFYIYDNKGYWKPYTDTAIRRLISDALGLYATGGRLNTILTLLKARTVTQDEFNRQEIFNFPNGVLDLKTGELKPHSPAYLSTMQMTYRYNPDAKCPKWDKFISEIMSGDPDKINLLHEVYGYVLVPDLRFQKFFIAYGDGANGKSVWINVGFKLFGEDNCTTVPISLFASQFEPIGLKDSLVNFVTETDTTLKDAEARLKGIVSGDKIRAAHKGQDAIEFRPRCPIISATNRHFQTSDTSKGMIRRIIYIGFNETFEGKNANKNLTAELCDELPGIFNRTYEGYKRLMQNQEFTKTSENSEILDDFLSQIDTVEAFYQEESITFLGQMESKELYTRYQTWCKDAGHNPQSRQKFTRSLKAVLNRHAPYVKILRNAQGYMFDFDSKPENNYVADNANKYENYNDDSTSRLAFDFESSPSKDDPESEAGKGEIPF